jgi:hypothetical protein
MSEALDLDNILFPQKYDFVSGETLIYANSQDITYKILGVCKPHKLIPSNGSDIIKSIYNDENMPDHMRKSIVNIIYGLSNKRCNTKEYGQCFKDMNEARMFSDCCIPMNLDNGDKGYVAFKKGKRELCQGFMPVGRIVLDKSRILMHKLYSKLKRWAIAVKTDAIYVHPDNRENCIEAIKTIKDLKFLGVSKNPSFNDIGHIRCADTTMKAMNRRLQIIKNQSADIVCLAQNPIRESLSLTEKQEMATLDNNWDAVDALMPRTKKSQDELTMENLNYFLDVSQS